MGMSMRPVPSYKFVDHAKLFVVLCAHIKHVEYVYIVKAGARRRICIIDEILSTLYEERRRRN